MVCRLMKVYEPMFPDKRFQEEWWFGPIHPRHHSVIISLLVRRVLASVLLALALWPTPLWARADCSPTVPPDPAFIPPAPYPVAPPEGAFWYGTPGLWTGLSVDGTWGRLPKNDKGYRQKIFWWTPGDDRTVESSPQLTVIGARLDAAALPLIVSPATNAEADDLGGWAMLVGVDIPTPGCWVITGAYRGQAVSFIVAVEP